MNYVTINNQLRSATNNYATIDSAQGNMNLENFDISNNSDQVMLESDLGGALLKVGLLLFFATLACFCVLQA